jgi:DNA-binding transcriptional ArsR family regulator
MAKFWTLDRAGEAIRAAFFSRSILSSGKSEEVWLRFSQLGEAISAAEGRIGDRTLSRALKALVASGQLRRRQEGRATFYRLVLPKSAQISAYARAEGASVESAGSIGAWGEPLEGWAVFGVPEIVPRKYRRQVRAECLRHQTALREVLDDVLNEFVDSVLRPAKKRVHPKVYRAGEKAITRLLEIQLVGVEGIAYSSRLWQLVEHTVPGTLSAYRKSILPNVSPEVSLGEGIALVISKLGGIRLEEVRPEIEKELVRLQRRVDLAAASFKPLWEALTRAEQERAGRRLEAASKMTAAMTSVVHA